MENLERRSEDSLDGEDYQRRPTPKRGKWRFAFTTSPGFKVLKIAVLSLTDTPRSGDHREHLFRCGGRLGEMSPSNYLLVRCATCDHVLVDESEASRQPWWRLQGMKMRR